MDGTVLVTGATSGIGRQTAWTLAGAGQRVLVHGRDPARVREVVGELTEISLGQEGAQDRGPRHARHAGYVADLASIAEVRRLGDEVAASERRLDVLLHNAGVFMNDRRVTVDGLEMTFAVNHLAPFLLTRMLRPLLAATGRTGQGHGRVVTVASMAHMGGSMSWDDPQLERRFTGHAAYAQSKLANILFSNALARSMAEAGEGTTSNSLHPGVITTKLLDAGWGMQGASLEEGARTSVHLALSESVEGVTGRFFDDRRQVDPSPQALDEGAQDRLWELSERLVDSAVAV